MSIVSTANICLNIHSYSYQRTR